MLAVTHSVEAALNLRCDAWHLRLDKLSFERNSSADAKTRALQDVAKSYDGQRFTLGEVTRARLGWLDRLCQQHRDRLGEVTLVLESRLLLHLGRANALENVGLYCDHTTGLPIVPGTALKGVVSTWACWEANQNTDGSFNAGNAFMKQRCDLARRILGDDSPRGSDHAGGVIFVGGFPTSPPKLGLDIVNPHYRTDGSVETRLTPSTFLCVEPDPVIFWRFVYLIRHWAADAATLRTTAGNWITEALTQVGIGAKTAGGYGRFRKPNDTDLALKQKSEAEAAAAQAVAAKTAEIQAEHARRKQAAEEAMKSAYPNDSTFKNVVLCKLTPGLIEQLRSQVAILQKPENASWLEKLRQVLASKDYRDMRRLLRQRDWFPKDWLLPR